MITLAIETSCDDTSVALLENRRVLCNLVSSQIVNPKFTGIVPELAARAHQANLLPVVRSAMERADVRKNQIDLVAATAGPGLLGSLLVGLNFAKALAYGMGVPFIGVNHIEAHMLAAFVEHSNMRFPFVALIVSGGHTMLVHARALGQYEVLGETLDDAAGECYDKVARILGLLKDGQVMGGPVIDRLSQKGDGRMIAFPRPMLKEAGLDFSFSGLKTAVMNFVSQREVSDQADVAASFQEAVVDVLVGKCARALGVTGVPRLVVCGGVAANRRLRERLHGLPQEVFIPSAEYCTDNAAMVAIAGRMHADQGETSALSVRPFAKWERVTQK